MTEQVDPREVLTIDSDHRVEGRSTANPTFSDIFEKLVSSLKLKNRLIDVAFITS